MFGDGSERRQLTVLFCDLVGSTALSERMPPEDLQALLREYHQRCTAIVRGFRGHVAQYLGDGLMVYFGYPVATEDTARRAVDAGLALVDAIAGTKLDDTLASDLSVRVGIHTGPVVVGDMGDTTRPERLAVGPTPNLAARVQAQADRGTVLLSEATWSLVAGFFDVDDVGARELPGVSRPVKLYRVLGRAAAASTLSAAERRGFSRFVGRESELTLLIDRWNHRGDSGRRVMLVGEPGFGKSRLLHELTQLVSPRKSIQIAASEFHQGQAFFPIAHYLERWLGLAPTDSEERKLERLSTGLAELGHSHATADLAPLLSIGRDRAQSQLDAPSLRHHAQLLNRLVDLFGSLVQQGLELLLFEDLHWADPSTLEFIRVWSGRTNIHALTVVSTRPGSLPQWTRPGFEVLELQRLSPAAARQVAESVAARLGTIPSDALLISAIDRAEGVPLFIEEITRNLAEMTASPSTSLSDALIRLPASLQDSLMARLDRLGSAKAVVQVAAVIGREIPLAWISEIVPVDLPILRRDLEDVVAAGLLREEPSADRTYVFSHALVCECAYQSLTRGAREEIHQRVAEILATRHPELARTQPLLLAHHYIAGAMAANAIRYLRDAGQQMLAASAFVEAIDVFNRALDLVPGVAASETRDRLEIELLTSLGLALISTRGYSSIEVQNVYMRAQQLCERFGDVPLRVLYGMWISYFVSSDVRGVNRLAPFLQRIIETSTDAEALVVAHSCLGTRAFYRVRFREARQYLTKAIELIDQASPRSQHGRMLTLFGFEAILSGPLWLAWVEALEGDEVEAHRLLRDAQSLAEKAGDPYLECMAATHAAALRRELCDVDGARDLVARASRLSTEHELHFWNALVLCVQGWVALQEETADRRAQCLPLIRAGLATLDAVGSLVNRAYFATYEVEAYLHMGELDDGLNAVDEALGVSRETLGSNFQAELLRLKGALLERKGLEEEATEHFRSALAESRIRGLPLLEIRAATNLSNVLARHRKVAEAREVLERSCSPWSTRNNGHYIRIAREALAALKHDTDN
jgi:class 3 adenylate cyclase/tetratricopeptide (TPR) repeat protein